MTYHYQAPLSQDRELGRGVLELSLFVSCRRIVFVGRLLCYAVPQNFQNQDGETDYQMIVECWDISWYDYCDISWQSMIYYDMYNMYHYDRLNIIICHVWSHIATHSKCCDWTADECHRNARRAPWRVLWNQRRQMATVSIIFCGSPLCQWLGGS